MLSLLFALALAEPAAVEQAAPLAAPAPVVKAAKPNPVTCRWVTNSGGIALNVCKTKREWRLDQMERQRRVDDSQRRAMTIPGR